MDDAVAARQTSDGEFIISTLATTITGFTTKEEVDAALVVAEAVVVMVVVVIVSVVAVLVAAVVVLVGAGPGAAAIAAVVVVAPLVVLMHDHDLSFLLELNGQRIVVVVVATMFTMTVVLPAAYVMAIIIAILIINVALFEMAIVLHVKDATGRNIDHEDMAECSGIYGRPVRMCSRNSPSPYAGVTDQRFRRCSVHVTGGTRCSPFCCLRQ